MTMLFFLYYSKNIPLFSTTRCKLFHLHFIYILCLLILWIRGRSLAL
nr:MAG TPA: hypothetical protein [Caudoviricetes sp.]